MDIGNRSKRKRSEETRTIRRSSSPTRNLPSLENLHRLFVIYTSFEDAINGKRPFEDSWLTSVLAASRSDTIQEKRLAARLLLSMLPRYPHHREDCLTPLLYFSSYRPSPRHRPEEGLCHRLRLDAIRALELLLVEENSPEIVTKVIRHLLCIMNEQHRSLYGHRIPNGNLNERTSAEIEYKQLLFSLEHVFYKQPKRLLEECLKPCEVKDTGVGIAPEVFFERIMLPGLMDRREKSTIRSLLISQPELLHWILRSLKRSLETELHLGHEPFHRSIQHLNEIVVRLVEEKEGYHGVESRRGWLKRQRSGSHSGFFGENNRPIGRYFGPPPPPPPGVLFRAPPPPPPPPRHPDEGFFGGHRGSAQGRGGSHEEFGPCVWFASLPDPMTKEKLVDICSRYGSIQSIVFPPAVQDKALVMFESSKQAFCCCQEVQLCHPTKSFCINIPSAKQIESCGIPLSTFLWIDTQPSSEMEKNIIKTMKEAHRPLPRHILKFEGSSKGFLLELQTLAMVNPTLATLHQFLKKNPISTKPKPPPTTSSTPKPIDQPKEEAKAPEASKTPGKKERGEWKGRLVVKGKDLGVVQCEEDLEWYPEKLEMNSTMKLQNVLGVYLSLAPSKRHITLLQALQHPHRLERLKKYLLQRKFAGVVHSSNPASSLYLIPSSILTRRFLNVQDNDGPVYVLRVDDI